MGLSFEIFNQRQKQTITYDSGPLLVISGAGTGKTHVIAGRILYLIFEKGVPPDQILALTFNEKACAEMHNRVERELPLGHPELHIYTFHAFCDRVLRECGIEIGISPNYKILRDIDLWLFLKRHVLDFKLEYYRSLGNPQKFLTLLQEHFSRLQDEDISPEDYSAYAKKRMTQGKTPEEKEEAEKICELAHAYEIYENLLLTNDYLDFGGLLFYTLRLFEKRKSVLQEYQNRFRYILVDEFQDTNFAQNKIVTLIAQKHKNLFVVGDDDQSIYKWRGASLTNIQYFKKLFPKAHRIVLNENYRSHQGILDAAYKLIQHNNPNRLEVTESVDKKLISTVSKTPSLPEIHHFSESEEEVSFVVEKTQAYLKKGMDTAILVRTNAFSKPFLDVFKERFIPVQHFSPSALFTKPAVKDSIALLRAIADTGDDMALFRLLEQNLWKIPMEELTVLLSEAKRGNRTLYEIIGKNNTAIMKKVLTHLIEYSRDHTVSEVLAQFFKESGYLKTMEEHVSMMQDIAAFSEKVKQFEETHEYTQVNDFLSYVQLLEESTESNTGDTPLDPSAVKILTIHGAKGLEFDSVIIPGLVQWKFPTISRRYPFEIPQELLHEDLPEGDHHLEEERRLFYVACTRARTTLMFSYSDFYETKKQWKPSIFICELRESGKVIEQSAKKKRSFKTQTEIPFLERKHRRIELTLPKLSYSQIDTFRTCPLKYQFRYLFDVPAPVPPHVHFGTSIHNTLRDFYMALQKNPELTTKDLSPFLADLYNKDWIPYGYETRELQEDQKRRGRKLLQKFYEKERDNFRIPVFLEKQFTLDLDKVKVSGRIDRIDQLPDGTYEVIDYKTGENTEKNLKNDLQLSIYALACKEVLKLPVSKLSLYYLVGPEKISTTRSAEELEACREEIIACANQLASSDFSPTPGYHCRYCEYRLICPAAMAITR